MKRCPYCGAKNKESFEYCVRCSEALDDVPAAWSPATASRSPFALIVALVTLAIVALFGLALFVDSGADSAAPQPVAAAASPAPPAPSRRGEPIFVDIDSKEVLAAYNEALAAFNAGDYAMAINGFGAVVRDLPDNPAAWQYLGLAHFHSGDFNRAVESLGEARNLRPDSFALLDHYVTACKSNDDVDAAIAALLGFVEAHPGELDARLELARLARASGDEELAMEQTAYLAERRDSDPEFTYEHGVTLKTAGKLDEAKAALRKSVELDPESAVAHHALGVTELATGNAEAALGAFEQAVSREPDNGDFRFSLAQAYEKLDRIPESLQAYEDYLSHAREDDERAAIVRRQLELAKAALAAERARGARSSESGAES